MTIVVPQLWFEDLEIGRIDRFGRHEVTREEALDFAHRYDPQPFHVDDEAAAKVRVFGRLSTSGWHTAAMGMRMTADHYAAIGLATSGAAAIDELRFLTPVYPGDTLRAESEILDARTSRSRPDIGIVRVKSVLFNQHDAAVLSHIATIFIPRRPA